MIQKQTFIVTFMYMFTHKPKLMFYDTNPTTEAELRSII
jgi:hypothetical protein